MATSSNYLFASQLILLFVLVRCTLMALLGWAISPETILTMTCFGVTLGSYGVIIRRFFMR